VAWSQTGLGRGRRTQSLNTTETHIEGRPSGGSWDEATDATFKCKKNEVIEHWKRGPLQASLG